MNHKWKVAVIGGLVVVSAMGLGMVGSAADKAVETEQTKQPCKMESMQGNMQGDMMKSPDMMQKCMEMMNNPEMQNMMKHMMQKDPAFHQAMKDMVNSVDVGQVIDKPEKDIKNATTMTDHSSHQ